ncbi:hypothetical protein CAI21_09450 [Alkalilimnicola ehrlichii]|uniref:diguanylate cyclase n=1 Tax=Alkalilimnicola ehrlichii TaxID=351052 RepID=A0A3E0WVF9_9GAMM|nr:GGDEF domain-containing protein [Alkalilimnicola ehrlichii]RFA29295.1 hypothetical protein CAI21_09450 [Alkalilimnicola ehrlichii]RFA36808.1 hypothetical protein CAL65_09785 [Alkalilimnicola ehrlichii]
MATLSQLRERLRFLVLYQVGDVESEQTRAGLAADGRLNLEWFEELSAMVEALAALDAASLPVAVLCPGVAESGRAVSELLRCRSDLQVVVLTTVDDPRSLSELFRHRPVSARQVELLPAVGEELVAGILAVGDATVQRAMHRQAIRRTSERLAEVRPRVLDLTAGSVRHAIMESLPAGLIVLNDTGYVVEMNALAREMLQGPGCAGVGSKNAIEHVDTLLPKWSGQTGTATAEETVKISAGEQTRYLRVRSALLGGDRDKPLGTLITLEDVTERTRLEAEIAARTRELEEANARLEALSHTDPLTGLWNRRYFERRSCRELERAERNSSTLGLLMLDIDRFKSINDNYGHVSGDTVLKALTARLDGKLRSTDMLARVGGEEFAILLPDCDESYALEVAERLRVAIADTPIVITKDLVLPVTISIGIAVSRLAGNRADSCEKRLKALMQLADRRLYQAKASGRNRSVAAEPS